MVLHTNTNQTLQYLLNTSVEYFEFVGLQLATEGRDKTVYMNNTSERDTLTTKTWENGKWTKKTLPYYTKEESYKYLGLNINLDLNWEDQTNASHGVFMKYISYLYKKCFNATQTIEILNLVVFPAITYRNFT